MLKKLMTAILLIGCCGLAAAVTPPDKINFQGVLRDASNNPRNGDFDMIFRLYDAQNGGNEILSDSHLDAGSRPIRSSAILASVLSIRSS